MENNIGGLFFNPAPLSDLSEVVQSVSCNLLGFRQTGGLTEQTGGPPAEGDWSSQRVAVVFSRESFWGHGPGVTTWKQSWLSEAKVLSGSGRVGGCVAGCVVRGEWKVSLLFPLK